MAKLEDSSCQSKNEKRQLQSKAEWKSVQLNQDRWFHDNFISLQAWSAWCNDGGRRDVCFLISCSCPRPKCLVCLYWQVNNNFFMIFFIAVMDVLRPEWFLVLARNIWFIFTKMCSTWCALWVRGMIDSFRKNHILDFSIYVCFGFQNIFVLDLPLGSALESALWFVRVRYKSFSDFSIFEI